MIEVTEKVSKLECLETLRAVNHSNIEIGIKTSFGQIIMLDNDGDFLNLIWNSLSDLLYETAKTYDSVGFTVFEEGDAVADESDSDAQIEEALRAGEHLSYEDKKALRDKLSNHF